MSPNRWTDVRVRGPFIEEFHGPVRREFQAPSQWTVLEAVEAAFQQNFRRNLQEGDLNQIYCTVGGGDERIEWGASLEDPAELLGPGATRVIDVHFGDLIVVLNIGPCDEVVAMANRRVRVTVLDQAGGRIVPAAEYTNGSPVSEVVRTLPQDLAAKLNLQGSAMGYSERGVSVAANAPLEDPNALLHPGETRTIRVEFANDDVIFLNIKLAW